VQVFSVFERNPRNIGLARGGGAVRGAAHIGVLQVLEREGIYSANQYTRRAS
jgi:NTE family protein